MKAVLISIRPKWCGLIASRKKTIEVRKTRPKIETPFKCYIYCPKGGTLLAHSVDEELYVVNGKVIGEFVCDRIDIIDVIDNETMTYIRVNQKADMFITQETCLKINGLQRYLDDKSGYGWHISDLKIYDEPKELKEFRKPDGDALKKAPQSYMFVEEV